MDVGHCASLRGLDEAVQILLLIACKIGQSTKYHCCLSSSRGVFWLETEQRHGYATRRQHPRTLPSPVQSGGGGRSRLPTERNIDAQHGDNLKGLDDEALSEQTRSGSFGGAKTHALHRCAATTSCAKRFAWARLFTKSQIFRRTHHKKPLNLDAQQHRTRPTCTPQDHTTCATFPSNKHHGVLTSGLSCSSSRGGRKKSHRAMGASHITIRNFPLPSKNSSHRRTTDRSVGYLSKSYASCDGPSCRHVRRWVSVHLV